MGFYNFLSPSLSLSSSMSLLPPTPRADLSLGTVYRNLNQLCGRGLIRRVGPVNGQERYDGTLSPHSHFICNRCGAILDLPQRSPGQDWLETASVQYGFQAESCEFIVRGLCHECTHAQPDAQI